MRETASLQSIRDEDSSLVSKSSHRRIDLGSKPFAISPKTVEIPSPAFLKETLQFSPLPIDVKPKRNPQMHATLKHKAAKRLFKVHHQSELRPKEKEETAHYHQKS